MPDPILSVCLITYNHAKFIRQAIDGVLMQKVNFSWEFIIADDFSTDDTRKIIAEYSTQYPDIIKLVFQKINVGPATNWFDLLSAARGKYIAYFEGDDYWTDNFKLQNQVDFLENNQSYVGCFHNSEERYEDESRASILYCNYPSAQKITFRELSYANVIPSCSMVYKNRLFEFPPWFLKLKMGDWPLHLFNAQFGDYWYIPKVMAVHRLHNKSTWMLQDADRNNQFMVEAYEVMIKEFEGNKIFSDQLTKGKETFMNSIQKGLSRRQYKKRLKGFVINMIERL